MPRKKQGYDQAITQLAEYLSLSDAAIQIAEGWSILPETMQRHFQLLIDDYIGGQSAELRRLYENASHQDQLRFNRIVERAQMKKHFPPSK